ncbi:SH2 domain-containing adapter protein D [Gracilinanus agilis]|uniref:SH2 domain-containing adapter protein D n=1 Tax=Gracilinanus agilis TaxID=191870 RepID=UPI001CFD6402|nr:SH2 domain-containing adapter protein D [Gracilinanus agilis]
MAKWLRDYLSFGGRRPPPQPPKPDYTESDIFRAYRVQKSLDFEDPYEDGDGQEEPESTCPSCPSKPSCPGDPSYSSPKHRLIKVESGDLNRSKMLLGTPGEDKVNDSEYSDPFDAQPEAQLGAPEQLPPDNSYMEPYDAQCVVTGECPCRRVDLQLYDTPYEEEVAGDSPEAEERPRQSRLPRDDERPAEEYDQPWEWKKDHISRAFAVQFETPEWERAPGLAKELRRPPAKTSGWVGKGPDPEEHIPQPAERVDPALPLEKQPWFHGSLSRAEAENLLALCREGSYLVRQSETSHPDFSLSLRSSQGYMHMKFTRTKENKFVLGQHSGVFSSVPEVVHHYSLRPLPVQGTEHLALLHPIPAQIP